MATVLFFAALLPLAAVVRIVYPKLAKRWRRQKADEAEASEDTDPRIEAPADSFHEALSDLEEPAAKLEMVRGGSFTDEDESSSSKGKN